MKRIIVYITFLLVVIIAVAAMYFSKLSLVRRNSDKALSFIPADAAIVLEFTNDKSFQDIFKDYPIFAAVIGKKETSGIFALQQLMNHIGLPANAEGNDTYLSFHHNKAQSELGLLWLMSLTKTQKKDDIYNAILNQSSIKPAQKIQFPTGDAIQINLDSLSMPFYFSIENSTAIGSFSKSLLQQCLGQNPKIDKKFISEITSGTQKNGNSLVNLFVNHNAVPEFYAKFFNGNLSGNFLLLNQTSGFSTLNMNFKSDALMFNGIATVDSASIKYLNLFRYQKPVKTNILKSFPSSTANYIAFGLSNFTQFNIGLNRLLNSRNQLSKLQHQFELLKSSSGVDINRDVKKFFSNEFAVLELANQQKLAIIKLTNGANMARVLNLISRPYTEQIRQLNNANIFYYSFGDPMLGFPRPFYIIVDNYLVLANVRATLQQFLYNYMSDYMLAKTPAFIGFNQFIANQSNISYFVNIQNSKGMIKTLFRQHYANNFKDASFGLDKFYGLSYQWSADGGVFFTNMYANLIDSTKASDKNHDNL